VLIERDAWAKARFLCYSLEMGLRRALVMPLLLLLSGCGERGPDAGAADVACPDESCLPESYGVVPQGADRAPNIDEVLDEQTPAATTSLTVGSSGGSASLPGGFALDVPAGALPAGTVVEISRYFFEGAPLDSVSDFYRVQSPVQPTVAVTMTFPLPGDLSAVDPAKTYVSWQGAEADGKPTLDMLAGTVDTSAGTISVQATHFSAGQAHNDGVFKGFASATFDTVSLAPYYNQGLTQNCWSVALTILLRAYGAGGSDNSLGQPRMKPWENNAFFGIDSEHGLTPTAFLSGQRIVDRVKAVLPGRNVERRSWRTTLGSEELHAYVDQRLREGRPIMMWFQKGEFFDGHMVVLLGIEGSTYVLHDPAIIGYSRMTWPEIEESTTFGLFPDGTYTLTLDAPANPLTQKASVAFVDTDRRGAGVTFMPIRNGKSVLGELMVFRWYLEGSGAHGVSSPKGTAPGVVPPDARVFVHVDFTNNVPGAVESPVFVGFELLDSGGSLLHQSPEVKSSVPVSGAWATARVTSTSGSPLDKLLNGPGSYTLRAYVKQDGVREDEASVPFTLGAAPSTGKVEPPCWPGPLEFPNGMSFTLKASEFDVATGVPKSPKTFYNRCGPYDPVSCQIEVSWLCRYERLGAPTDVLMSRAGVSTGSFVPSSTSCADWAAPAKATSGGAVASSSSYALVNLFDLPLHLFAGNDQTEGRAYAETELTKYLKTLEPLGQACN
jgi:hypothetical protein